VNRRDLIKRVSSAFASVALLGPLARLPKPRFIRVSYSVQAAEDVYAFCIDNSVVRSAATQLQRTVDREITASFTARSISVEEVEGLTDT
jgi:hypothetical protein